VKEDKRKQFKVAVGRPRCVCVCVCERERKRDTSAKQEIDSPFQESGPRSKPISSSLSVCVWETDY